MTEGQYRIFEWTVIIGSGLVALLGLVATVWFVGGYLAQFAIWVAS